MSVNSTSANGLANGAGIAAHFGVTRTAVSNWGARNGDYPRPIAAPYVIGIPIWLLSDVIEWHAKHFAPQAPIANPLTPLTPLTPEQIAILKGESA